MIIRCILAGLLDKPSWAGISPVRAAELKASFHAPPGDPIFATGRDGARSTGASGAQLAGKAGHWGRLGHPGPRPAPTGRGDRHRRVAIRLADLPARARALIDPTLLYPDQGVSDPSGELQVGASEDYRGTEIVSGLRFAVFRDTHVKRWIAVEFETGDRVWTKRSRAKLISECEKYAAIYASADASADASETPKTPKKQENNTMRSEG